jgi:hypothetical protein
LRLGRLRTRSFVTGLVTWSALAMAPIVALAPPLGASFVMLAFALAVCATLLFSLRLGIAVAAVCAGLFWVVLAVLALAPRGTPAAADVLGVLFRAAVALPAGLAAVGLAGSVAFAELVSMGLEWDVVPRTGGGANGFGGTRSGRGAQRVRVNREGRRR